MSDEKKYSDEEKIAEFVKSQEGEVAVNPVEAVGTPIQSTEGAPLPWQKKDDHVSLANQIGWQQIKVPDLPTQGLFYPKETEVVIRAATGAEIRHWSTLNEQDLSALDDMLNYVIERCVQVKNKSFQTSWKDIKEIDRFYLLLAVSELTFIKGENKLQVKVSDDKKIDVKKDMIQYITFDPRLMKYYDEDLRSFNIHLNDGTSVQTTLPSVGVTNWLKKYVIRKNQAQQPIDEDFISFAPFIIKDWRGLDEKAYQAYMHESNEWTLAQVSGLTHFKEIFMDTVDPVVRYKDAEGGEREVALNFQGGIKSIFLISDPFSQLA